MLGQNYSTIAQLQLKRTCAVCACISKLCAVPTLSFLFAYFSPIHLPQENRSALDWIWNTGQKKPQTMHDELCKGETWWYNIKNLLIWVWDPCITQEKPKTNYVGHPNKYQINLMQRLPLVMSYTKIIYIYCCDFLLLLVYKGWYFIYDKVYL